MEDDDPTLPVRLALGGMIGMTVAMGIGRFVYTPILPGMMAELGLSPADAGWIASANYLGYLVGALAGAGAWAAGLERRLMLAGLAASTALAFLMGLTDSLAAFLVIRFLAGFASAVVMVFLAAIVLGHLAEAGRADLQGVHFSGVGVGIVLSSLMMLALVSAGLPWESGWRWSALLSLLGSLAVLRLVDRDPPRGGADPVEPRLPRDRTLLNLIVAYGLFGFGYIVTATFLIAIVRQDGGSRSFEAAVWLVTGLAVLPSLHLWGIATRRRGPVAAFIAGCLVEAVGVAASVSLPGAAGPVLGGVLLGGTFVAATAYGLQAGRLLAPRSPRRAFALMTASFGLGQILGPIVAGLIAERTGSFFAGSMLAALALLAAAGFAWPAMRRTLPASNVTQM